MIRKVLLVFGLAFLALPQASSAEGRGPSSRPLKERQCVQECREANHDCVDAARTQFRTCAQETCSNEADAARAACEADPTADDCKSARDALRTCLKPCFDPLKDALTQCRSDLVRCVELCPDREPPVPPRSKDPQCVAGCRGDLGECLDPARQAARECVAQCGDEVDAARQACADGPSDACRTARRTASDCLQSCGQALRRATAPCLDAADDCVRACPDREPPVRPMPPWHRPGSTFNR